MNTDKQLDYLRNGAAVITRRLHQSDRKKIRNGFDALSQLSRYRRFLHNKNELKQSEIDCLFATPENQGASFIALECNNTRTLAEGRCIGLIQLIEFVSDKSSAEVALVVIDEFHNCGLAKLLLNTIEKEAANRNICSLYFYSTSDNKPLTAILKRTSWDITVDREFGSVTFITKVVNNRQPEPLKEFANSAASAANIDSKQIDQRQLLTTLWFKVYLRMITFMNQISMRVYKGQLKLLRR